MGAYRDKLDRADDAVQLRRIADCVEGGIHLAPSVPSHLRRIADIIESDPEGETWQFQHIVRAPDGAVGYLRTSLVWQQATGGGG